MAELFHVGNARVAIESPNDRKETIIDICLHLKGPSQETGKPKRAYISRGIPFFIELLCDIATNWTLAELRLSHYASEAAFCLTLWGHSTPASAYRPFLPTNQMNAASHPRVDASPRFRSKSRLEDIARGFPDTFPVSKCGTYVAKVMFTRWETMNALPGIFPLYPLNVSFGSVRATGEFQLGRNQ
jgi:hypothetical protein